VDHVDPTVLERLSDFVPVVASVGVDNKGQSYNINADTVAASLAAALHARKVLFLTDVEGLLADPADPASLISECTLAELQIMLDGGSIGGGMLPKLSAARHALEHGVGAAHIVDGRQEHSVLIELFTEAGIGTKITP
jgi:acetylglutamate kinase